MASTKFGEILSKLRNSRNFMSPKLNACKVQGKFGHCYLLFHTFGFELGQCEPKIHVLTHKERVKYSRRTFHISHLKLT